MNLQQLKDTIGDFRIVKINGNELTVHQNVILSRKNIECYSKKLAKYIEEENLNFNDWKHIQKIYNFFDTTDDIEFIGIVNYG